MIQIKIGNDTYKVDETPLKEKLLQKAELLINSDEHPVIKDLVVMACKPAIKALGWDKPREVSTLQFMSEKLVDLIFQLANENGIELQGEKLVLDVVDEITAPVMEDPQPVVAPEPAQASAPQTPATEVKIDGTNV